MRVAHVITNLEVGGAQIMLQRLVTRLQASGVSNAVIGLGTASHQFDDLRRLGISVDALGMHPHVPSPLALLRLKRLLTTFRPDVVHTWMYHADLTGGLVARLGRVAPVIWGVHHTPHASERFKLITKGIIRVNARLSAFVPARIICCAHAAKDAHVALGFAPDRLVVIPNGFDTDMYRPDPAARISVRQELGLAPDTPLVGLMARFHPQKDHATFVRSAAHLVRQSSAAHFVLAGRGVTDSNPDLQAWLAASGSPDRFHVLGVRTDMPRLIAACDVVCTSSAFGEGLPLVLGEAMACGVPCVATDVGDSARLVADTGRIVPPGDVDGLAAGWASLLGLSRDDRLALGERARARIVDTYGLAQCADQHMALYREVRPLTEQWS